MKRKMLSAKGWHGSKDKKRVIRKKVNGVIQVNISKKTNISGWRPISELKQIEQNISEFGYSKEFIDKTRMYDKKTSCESDMMTGRINFFEPIEVREDGGVVFYRENEKHIYREISETFEMQYGIFNNHNNGEFFSWLGKDDCDEITEEGQELHRLFERGGFFVEGNYCDMFDCGEYVYAISNLMHMGLGYFKIVRINKNFESVVMYDNTSLGGWICLEYNGCFRNEYGYMIIASGYSELKYDQDEKRHFQDITLLFQIDDNGNCKITQEWKIQISSSNSTAVLNGFAYFGQNKMVTRLNLASGEMAYFTNKSDAELAALKEMW